MKLNFHGRVGNVVLANHRALLPVFEAIVNSIHAIEDSKRTDGRIDVKIRRNKEAHRQDALFGTRPSSRQILGFQIIDNGVGFNDANFNSFETSDSDHKRSRGAKGVGRFMWLKAFNAVHVKSIFRSDQGFSARKFDFSLDGNGVTNHSTKNTPANEIGTTVDLLGFFEKYERECPRTSRTIAERIIEHCLSYLMNAQCPLIVLADDDEDASITLNELYRAEIEAQSKRATVSCKGNELTINHVRCFASEFSSHTIHLCAHSRDVQHISLKQQIPHLPARIKTREGKLFVYKAYVSSSILDNRVNAERTSFDLIREGQLGSLEELTEVELIRAVVQAAETELSPFLSEVEDRLKSRIETLVMTKFPEYRPLLKEVDTYLREFPEDATESELLAKLNDIQFREDIKARDEAKSFLSEQGEHVRRSHKYIELQRAYLEKSNELARSRLAQCVIHRKIILDLLAAQVSCDISGDFPKEERIHEIIFPMRKTSEEVAYDRQNLWIIDERLAYHRFLASDKPIRAFSSNNQAKDEPDLFILNHPGVFAPSLGQHPVNSAVVVEFKRAERDSYKENPIQQVYRYVKKLREHEIRDGRGRTIQIHKDAVFYCYIIADLTPALRSFAEESSLDPTPDELGYIGFNRNYRAYVEVISYDKLLKDSNERNHELFKTLGLA